MSILADKIVALALRSNRLKNRDLWDIGWLKQQNTSLPLKLVSRKVADHGRSIDDFIALLNERVHILMDEPDVRETFIQEMRRFLPPQVVKETVEKKDFWQYLTNLIQTEGDLTVNYLAEGKDGRKSHSFF